MPICFLTPELYSISLCLLRKYIFLFRARKAGSWHNRIILLSPSLVKSHGWCLGVSVCFSSVSLPLSGFAGGCSQGDPTETQLHQVAPPELWPAGQRKRCLLARCCISKAWAWWRRWHWGPAKVSCPGWITAEPLGFILQPPWIITHQCLWEGNHVR